MPYVHVISKGNPARRWRDKMNNATDHGFNEYPRPREVRRGDVIRLKCALGLYEVRVVGRHRQEGWDCRFERWVTPVEPFRQGFVGSDEWHSHQTLLAAKYAD